MFSSLCTVIAVLCTIHFKFMIMIIIMLFAIAFRRDEKLSERYAMTSAKRGLCVVISNELFMPRSNFKRRVGAQVDVEMLHRVFIKLGFDVRQHRDVTAVKARRVLAGGLRQNTFRKYSVQVLCIRFNTV